VAVAAVVPLQLVILRVQEKLEVQVVEPLETMQEMEVRLLDWELRVKVLTVDYLPY
jgi:GMP synthase PP-ATPase subunit